MSIHVAGKLISNWGSCTKLTYFYVAFLARLFGVIKILLSISNHRVCNKCSADSNRLFNFTAQKVALVTDVFKIVL